MNVHPYYLFCIPRGIVSAGIFIGVFAPILQKLGNPANMGICVACMERDIAGALGLHRADVVQYLRPEIMGFVLGSLIAALIFGSSRPALVPLPSYVFSWVLCHGGSACFFGLSLEGAAPVGRRRWECHPGACRSCLGDLGRCPFHAVRV